jgi:cullin-4
LVDRTAILDAYVVKIMKGHKRMSLQLLVDAVIAAVHKLFPPDVKDIKKRVEDLIEREV